MRVTTTKAQRAAQARYDRKRAAPVSVGMNQSELAWLDSQRLDGEGRGTALKRLTGVPKERSQPFGHARSAGT